MSNGPSGDPRSPETTESTKRRRIWAKAGLVVGAIAVLGATGGALWLWVFIHERFAPWASQQLTDALDRPVYLGEVERVSLTSIRFGQSAMPPTDGDPDELVVDSLTINVNPLQLFTRTLSPEIVFENPMVYVEQDADGQWIDFEFEDEEEEDDETEPLIQVNPTIEIQSGEVTVVPYVGPNAKAMPLNINAINGTVVVAQVDTVDFQNQESFVEAQEIAFDLSAEPENAGTLEVKGIVQQPDYGEDPPPELENAVIANLAIQAQQLDLGVLSPVLLASLPRDLPLAVTSGTLNGNLEVEIKPQENPLITGTARVADGTLALDALETDFTDINAQARFRGNQAAFDTISTEFGAMAATAQGTIDLRNGYNLTGEIAPTTIAGIAEAFNFELPIETEGTLQAENVKLTGPLAEPTVTGQVTSTEAVTLDKITFANIASQVTYSREGLAFDSLTAAPLAGGTLTGDGRFAFANRNAGEPARLSLQLQGRNLPADAIAREYGLSEDFAIGTVALDADISGPLGDLTGVVSWDAAGGTYPTRGVAEVAANTVRIRNAELAGGTLSGVGRLIDGQWTADVVAQGLQLGVFNNDLQGITAGGDVQLAGSTSNFSLGGIRGRGDITAALRGGTLNSQVVLANGIWDADIQTRNFPIQQFATTIPVSSLSADAQLTGSLDNFSLAAIRGSGNFNAAVASGTVTSDFSLADGIFRLDGQGDNLQLAQLTRDLQGTADATFQLTGNVADLSLAGIQGRANLRLSDGLATAAGLNPALARSRSPLEASLVWNGRQFVVERLETAGLFASGTITPQLSGRGIAGIAAVDLGINADDYNLATLPVALPPALGLEGLANVSGRLTGTPGSLNFVGNVALADLALNDLVFDPLLAGNVNFSTAEGLAVALRGGDDEITVNYNPQARDLDFTIRAGDALAVADTEGDVLQAQLYNFPISVLNIPPSSSQYGSLRGQIEFATAAINLDTFNAVGQFDVQNVGIGFYSVDRFMGGFAYADGVAQLNEGQILMADRDGRGNIVDTRAYNLSGRYSFNQTPQLQATLATEEGQLRDIFEVLKIRELADLRRGFTPNEGFIPSSQAEAEAILATRPVGDPNASLLNQLRRLSEILELQIQSEIATEQAPIPPLSDLQGAFQGRVDLTATLPEDLQVNFDITGEDWTWGPDLGAEQVVAQGSYADGLISLAPLQFSSSVNQEPAYLVVDGQFSLDPEDTANRTLTLEAFNLPVNEFEDLANLPFDLDGQLNATAVLQGPLADPDLEGELEIVNGALNDTPIDQASATFAYAEARAALDAQLLLIGSDDPLTLSAQVPYQLGFVANPPRDRSYSLKANVEDEGFALLNLFTRQLVAWESGEGSLILNLEGDLDSGVLPSKFDGLILLSDATITSSALPAPMTDVTGKIRLLPRRLAIAVDELTGQFSEGQLSAQGVFPLFAPLDITEVTSTDEDVPAEDIPAEDMPAEDGPAADAPIDETIEDEDLSTEPAETTVPTNPTPVYQPLALNLENIDLNLKGLYSGQVNGDMNLGGSLVLGPVLSGEIDLTDGTITIPEGGNTTTAAPATTTSANGNGEGIPPFRFSDLRIFLLRNINVVQGNLLNVTARGALRIDGTLDSLRPYGTIQLPSGRVGIFAVALRLAGGNDRAEFRGNFDPILDVTLQTALADVGGPGIELTTSPFPRNEVSTNTIENIGLTQQGNSLVRINARYTGPASELADLTTSSRNLELSSSPPRSNQEIISLLSGNVIGALDALGSGDNAIAGIGTFVGSAVLNQVRDFLGDTVPISEFRIFQVSESTGGVNEGEDIGGEIGFQVSSNISVSVLKVLTNDTPFQFNTRYRISDQFTLRGTTSYEDFSDRTGVLLEYETRF